jgi:DNA-binding transcriptional regulator YhcF (GntR family)
MEFDPSKPIYKQIVEEFKKKRIRKDLVPGEKVPHKEPWPTKVM